MLSSGIMVMTVVLKCSYSTLTYFKYEIDYSFGNSEVEKVRAFLSVAANIE